MQQAAPLALVEVEVEVEGAKKGARTDATGKRHQETEEIPSAMADASALERPPRKALLL